MSPDYKSVTGVVVNYESDYRTKRELWIWDAKTGKRLSRHKLKNYSSSYGVQFSPSGRFILCENTLYAPTDVSLALSIPSENFKSVFSPDEKRLLVLSSDEFTSDAYISCWDIAGQRTLWKTRLSPGRWLENPHAPRARGLCRALPRPKRALDSRVPPTQTLPSNLSLHAIRSRAPEPAKYLPKPPRRRRTVGHCTQARADWQDRRFSHRNDSGQFGGKHRMVNASKKLTQPLGCFGVVLALAASLYGGMSQIVYGHFRGESVDEVRFTPRLTNTGWLRLSQHTTKEPGNALCLG